MGRAMQEADSDPFTEPELVSCVYLSGADIRLESGMLRFVGWQTVDGERRICVRYAIPIEVAREIHSVFKRLVFGGQH